ncbi:MAG: hypothetical protein QM679_03535 [Patulibacter sp.]
MEGDADAAEADELPAEPFAPWAPPPRRHRWLSRIVVLTAVLLPAFVVFTVVKRATGIGETAPVDRRLVGALRYDVNGDPLVLRPVMRVGTVQRRVWKVCGSACERSNATGPRFAPGEVLAGSHIELRVVGSKGEATVATPTWDGRLKALARPTLTGSPRVGVTVSANGGRWTGGWIGGRRLLGIRACPTQAGGGRCVALTASAISPGHDPQRVIPASFRGWWIGAIEWSVPPGRTFGEQVSDPARPAGAPRAPLRSVAVSTGPLDGPIR